MRTKLLLLLLIVFCYRSAYSQVKKDTLTNDKVIQLSKLDLSSQAIITKIQNSVAHFDVSVDGLIALKNNGVNGDVISEMIKDESKAETATANKKDINNPRTNRQAGIYYYNPTDTAHLFTTIDPTVVSNTQTGGAGTAIAQNLTYGLAKEKVRSTISGQESRRQIKDTIPVFYFYFDSTTQVNASAWWFSTATSPNEFALVELKTTKTSREMIVGSGNLYGQNLGIDEKQKIAFTYEEIGKGIYKVTPAESLDTGEYCFVFSGSTPTIYSNNKVFDFGIE